MVCKCFVCRYFDMMIKKTVYMVWIKHFFIEIYLRLEQHIIVLLLSHK